MQHEDHFPAGRPSRRLALRRGDKVMSDAGRMAAGPPVALRPRADRHIQRPLVPDSPNGDDAMPRTSSDTTWRVISTAVSGVIVNAGGGLAGCGEFAASRLLITCVSWICVQVLEGCAAYGAAMYPLPMDLENPPHRGDPQSGREEPNRPGRTRSGPGEIFPGAKGAIGGNATVLYLAPSSKAWPDAEFVVRRQAARAASRGWAAFIRSVAAGIRTKIRLWRDRRLAITELRSLDDRSLRDVGISRGDIEYVMRHRDVSERE